MTGDPAGNDDQTDATGATRMQALDTRIGKIENFVSVGRTKLNDIDLLLSEENK
jgi:hypothetical protein